ncbi:MAG: restriction endonuclease subunit S [Proteobacteria bacterium]|nr:restriction endonuclease subunit S [Pseudomonadota bacterium]
MRRLADLCEAVTVGHVGKTSQYYRAEGVPFLRTQNVGAGELALDDLKFITQEFHETLKKSQLKPGDVLVTRVVTDEMKCGIVPTSLGRANCANVILIRPKPELSPEFLSYLITSPAAQSYLLERRVGSAQQVVNTKVLKDWPVPKLPIEEQKRIVALLDQAFAALDRARAHAEANLADATALLSNWVSATFAASKGIWREKSLVDVCENLDRLRVPITKSDRESGTVPYYGASGVVDHVAAHIFDEDLLLVSEDGANLLARTYPIAFSIAGKAWVNNHAHVLRFDDLDTQEFVRLYLNSISLEPFVTGMAQPKLNQKALNGIPIPLPEITEQRRLVAQAREIGEASERARDRYDLQIADLTNLRQSLLQKAFSGQL